MPLSHLPLFGPSQRTPRLRAGTRIECLAGTLWLTLECAALPSASPDIVLQTGEHYRLPADGCCFLSSLGPIAARHAIVAPGTTAGPAQADEAATACASA